MGDGLGEELAKCDRAIARNPDDAGAWKNRGTVFLHAWYQLAAAGRTSEGVVCLEEALGSLDRAVALKPDYAEAFNNRGAVLHLLGQLDDGLCSFDQAIALKPDFANAFVNRGMAKLLLGDFREGWTDYEWRWKLRGIPGMPPSADSRMWQGEDLAGRSIAVYALGQGFGDIFQFARYLPLLVQRGAKVILHASPKVIRVLQPLLSGVDVVSSKEARVRCDFSSAIMSLPLGFGTELQTIPGEIPYLRAESDLAAKWKKRLGDHGFKIGIGWQAEPSQDGGRSIPLTEFSALCRLPGVRLICLQKNFGLDQLANLPAGAHIEVLGDEFDGGPDAFIDTAGAMANLDLIVSADISIAHLACALGRPAWVGLPYMPDWRWLLDREDSPWYPTMRLFRQEKDRDWNFAFTRIETELRRLLGAGGAR
jgi:tetratricopeptide repeat protein/protein prenyltransferase alpha subunit repeat-containing protein